MKDLRKSDLKDLGARMQRLADERGLRLERGQYDDFQFFFWEEGAKYHTAQLAVDFEFHRYYSPRDGDSRVGTFVVAGKFLPQKENRATAANAPWDSRYMKSKDLEKAIAALDKIARKDNPAERVERAAFEAKKRWNADCEYLRRTPGHSHIEMAVTCAALDGELPFFLSHGGDRVDEEISRLKSERDRYVGAWMALEIIDISRKVELASLGVES